MYRLEMQLEWEPSAQQLQPAFYLVKVVTLLVGCQLGNPVLDAPAGSWEASRGSFEHIAVDIKVVAQGRV